MLLIKTSIQKPRASRCSLKDGLAGSQDVTAKQAGPTITRHYTSAELKLIRLVTLRLWVAGGAVFERANSKGSSLGRAAIESHFPNQKLFHRLEKMWRIQLILQRYFFIAT